MNPNSQGPMQGLKSAGPMPVGPDDQGAGGGDLVQAATDILQQATSQFGPDIVDVLSQLLQSQTASQGPTSQMGGM